ncbi:MULTISPECIES: aerobic carbon-monoxide dehydrogenase large subunit [Rhodococcus]|jgi:carbon-monoxide dehydrogenase large subunit|uniref:Xanthine dehydrogenase n=1 Tax=Rhodococcus erythropolis TaxID=1833 RepID=A0A6G9D2V3_RHOER|nr:MULTISPECIES: aerobic carbon-monoxide dehydrogenase large subunit [Rhodococcus]AUS34946.1 xanthine dehydrogenase [Rhodococcus qingshengii]KDQ03522.1 xanthine dehydrogenase [Rhodococcus qingshengii]MBT9299054.1 xanthine dehydrogenase family protein molybdopterin-binding subunit [Rhodococcus sp. GOMB7]MCC4301840.1 xanthine dehydrogenase family protein molybdopterin-binding subunit [Rhodococcus sp. 3-2]MCJ0897783.1 aerobic carbon-monoxide dehydrogenase large subunit [Rhodococcus sp. ARC_M13]
MSTPVKPAKRNGAKHPASDHSTADHSVADDGKFFGKPIPREEDTRLLSGQGRYLDDLGHNALIAAFVRSPHAHARIIDIDIDQALEVPGVHAIYTYEDLLADTPEMAENLPLLIPHPGIIAPRNGYPLAKDEVKHVGEAIAMVVADNRYIAEDACAKIDVTYEALKPVVGIDVARTAANAVHADVPDNVAAHLQHGFGDLDAELAAAPHRLTLDLEIERSASMPMEGKGVYARWDGDENTLTFWTSTQTSTSARAAIAARLGMALNKVHCIAPDVGGGFGVKIVHPWPEEVMITWAARRLGQAGISCEVKWVEDRREHFISSAHERGQIQKVDIGFDDEGRLLAFDFTFWHDNGAYLPYGIIVMINTATQVLGPYKPKSFRVNAYSLYTNTVIVTPYRGAGRPQAVFAMERSMDAIAKYLNKDKIAVREANFIRPEDMPYDFGLMFQDGRPLIYDTGDYQAGIEKLKKLIDWDGFPEYQRKARAEGRSVGIGIGAYVEGTGPGPYEGAHVVVETSGKVKAATGLTTQGQGHQTAFAQIVADDLGVKVSDVEIVTGDTRRFGYAVGTFASRGAVMSGSAFHVAAQMVAEKAKKIASGILDLPETELELREGHVCKIGTEAGVEGTSVPLSVVAVLSNPLRYAFDRESKLATGFAKTDTDMSKPPIPEGEQPGLEATGYYSPPSSTFASGVHAAIVETDPVTAEITVRRYVVIHDCGNVINPRIVEGQVMGAVAQGIGGALYERIVYDEHGQMLNASYMDFLMPFVTEMPDSLEMDHTVTPSGLNPLGMKGAGEAGVIPTSAVIAAAIEDAEGISITSMPISPSELFELRLAHAGSSSEENA